MATCEAENCVRKCQKKSESFKSTLELLTKEVTVIEGGSVEYIKIRSPIPPSMICSGNDTSNCVIKITVRIKEQNNDHKCFDKTKIPQFVVGYPFENGDNMTDAFCGIELPHSEWDKVLEIPIKAKIDRIFEKGQTYIRYAEIVQTVYVGGVISKESVIIGQVIVKVVDMDKPSTCMSYGDPHFKTFDAQMYNLYREGEFILYKHKIHRLQVNVLLKGCAYWGVSTATCICVVAVKIDDDVIIIDTCGGLNGDKVRKDSSEVTAYLNGELLKSVRIQQFANDYRIILPTGTIVITKTWKHDGFMFMNAYIETSPYDWEMTDGLCGFFNGKKVGELIGQDGVIYKNSHAPNAFIGTWLVTETLFGGYCPPVEEESNSTESNMTKTEYVFCDCIAGQEKCDAGLLKRECALNKIESKWMDITNFVVDDAAPHDCANLDNKPEIDIKPTPEPPEKTWPVKNITKNKAREICKESLTIIACGQTIDEEALNRDVESCMADILLSESLKLIGATVEAAKAECEITEGNKPDPDPDVTNKLCPNNCSGHGKCEEGICQCDSEFTGDDCSFKKGKKPNCSRAVCSGLLCKFFTIWGWGFQRSKSISCHFQKWTISKSSVTVTGNSIKTSAVFISGSRIRCTLPKDDGDYTISVSNDGGDPCEEPPITPKLMCHKCFYNKQGKLECTIKKNTCYIDDKCYSTNQLNPNSNLQICRSSVDPYNWTNIDTVDYSIWFPFDSCRRLYDVSRKYEIEGEGTFTKWGQNQALSFENKKKLLRHNGNLSPVTSFSLTVSAIFEKRIRRHVNLLRYSRRSARTRIELTVTTRNSVVFRVMNKYLETKRNIIEIGKWAHIQATYDYSNGNLTINVTKEDTETFERQTNLKLIDIDSDRIFVGEQMMGRMACVGFKSSIDVETEFKECRDSKYFKLPNKRVTEASVMYKESFDGNFIFNYKFKTLENDNVNYRFKWYTGMKVYHEMNITEANGGNYKNGSLLIPFEKASIVQQGVSYNNLHRKDKN